MAKAVFGIAQNRPVAEEIVANLKASGFSNNDISAIFPDKEGTRNFAHERTRRRRKVPRPGAGTGGLLGGTLGWLAGIGTLAIPGVGPLIAAGPIWLR